MPAPALPRLAAALAKFDASGRCELAKRVGVEPRFAHRAKNAAGRVDGRPFPAQEYLALAAALGIHPFKRKGVTPWTPGKFSPHAFACAIKIGRIEGLLSLREAAAAWNVALVTLARAENGVPISIDPMLAICDGLDRDPYDFFHGKQQVEQVDRKRESVDA